MGLAATVAAGGGPQAIDMGALFGLGARPPAQPEKSWSWQPPAVPLKPPPRPSRTSPGFGMSLEHSMLGAGPPPPPAAQPWLSSISKIKVPLVQTPYDPQKAIRTSKVKFDGLLHALGSQERIDKEAIQPLITFLQSNEDEPLAHNLPALCNWMTTKDIMDDALVALISCVEDKIRLRTLEAKQLASVFDYLVRRAQVTSFESILVRLLDTMVSILGETSIRPLARSLEQVYSAGQGDDGSIRFWFSILDSCKTIQGPRASNAAWEQFYKLFAASLQPAQLSEHLCKLAEEDLVEVILRYWVPKYIDAPSSETPEPLTFKNSMRVNLRRMDRTKAGVVIAEMRKEFTELRSKVDGTYHQHKHLPFRTFFEILSRRDITYSPLMLDLTNMFIEQKCSDRIYALFRAVEMSPDLGVPLSTADRMIEYFQTSSQNIDLARAFRVFKATPSVSLLSCGELPLTLINRGLGRPDRIFLMLSRQHGPDIVPDESRQVRRQRLPEKHVKIVHYVAYHWAESRHNSARVAFRRIWECYRFLRDRGAEISVLVSRALVKAGILRPLQEGKSVSKSQVQYILSIVKDVEGEDVAKNLDDAIWDWSKRLREPGNPLAIARQRWAMMRRIEGAEKGLTWRRRLWTLRAGRWADHRGLVRTKGERSRLEKHEGSETIESQPLAVVVDQDTDEMSLPSASDKETNVHDALSRAGFAWPRRECNGGGI